VLVVAMVERQALTKVLLVAQAVAVLVRKYHVAYLVKETSVLIMAQMAQAVEQVQQL
jgi:hypothetical protein